jgi:hypothetical protein
MTTPQSPNTRPTDLETPGDVDTPDVDTPDKPVTASTNADVLREQAISDSHAREDLLSKQDTQVDRHVAEGEDTSSDIKAGAAIQIPGEL